MKIQVFDTETTGLVENPEARIIEIAWAVWDTVADRVAKAHSLMMDPGGQLVVPEEITKINGLTSDMVSCNGVDSSSVLDLFFTDAEACDAWMARNGEHFDIPMIKRECLKMDKEMGFRLPCIDDTLDIQYPEDHKGRNLSHIAADHGFLNPFPHVALGDVLTLIRVMQLGKYDMQAAYESAQSPVVKVQAMVSYNDRNQAKDIGFKWDPELKIWHSTMRESAMELAQFPFKTRVTRLCQ